MSDNESRVTVPLFSFVGHDDRRFQLQIKRIAMNSSERYEGEVDLNEDVRELLTCLVQCAIGFVSSVGVDVSSRMVNPNKFHFFHIEEFKKIWGENNGNQYIGQGGFSINYRSDMFISVDDNIMDVIVLKRANHELLHLLSHRVIRFTQTGEFGTEQIGFWKVPSGEFKLLDEGTIELWNYILITSHWLQFPLLHKFVYNKADFPFAYYEVVVLIDAILAQVSESRVDEYNVWFNKLINALTLGDTDIWYKLSDKLGEDIIAVMGKSSIDEINSLHSCRDMAITLGLKKLAHQLEDYLMFGTVPESLLFI